MERKTGLIKKLKNTISFNVLVKHIYSNENVDREQTVFHSYA